MGRRARPGDEQGFTLVELVILGVLVLLAYTAMHAYHDRAANAAARAALRQAVPAAEAYFSDNATYAGMDNAALTAYDSAVPAGLTVVSADGSTYCLAYAVRGRQWSVSGPGATTSDYVANGSCS